MASLNSILTTPDWLPIPTMEAAVQKELKKKGTPRSKVKQKLTDLQPGDFFRLAEDAVVATPYGALTVKAEKHPDRVFVVIKLNPKTVICLVDGTGPSKLPYSALGRYNMVNFSVVDREVDAVRGKKLVGKDISVFKLKW